MKRFRLMFASLLMMAGAMTTGSAAATITIPTADNSALDPNEATIEMAEGNTKAGVKGNPPHFDYFCHGDKAIFTIDNTVEQVYTISFEASTNRAGNIVQLIITDADNNEELNETVAIEKGNWTTFNPYSVKMAKPLTTGVKTFTLVFLNEGGSGTTVNVQNIGFTTNGNPVVIPSNVQDVPGPLDLTKGELDGGKIKNITVDDVTYATLDSFKDGKSASYDINVTEEGKYKITFVAACKQDDVRLGFTVTDKTTGDVEADVEKSIINNGDWSDFSTEYSVDVPALTKGEKSLKITFRSIEGKYTTNVATVEFVKDGGLSGISNVNVREADRDNSYYTLSGVRTAAPAKGIYIKNGKKIIVNNK